MFFDFVRGGGLWYNARRMSLPTTLQGAFPPRPLDANKYTVGTVTVVGGSHRFVHAPAITGLGARAAGAGLVHLVVPDASRIAAAALVPEATFMKQTATCVPPKADVTVVGMGLGVSANSEMLVSRLLSDSRGSFVLDADALTILANWYAKRDAVPSMDGQVRVLTPHAGEAARLLACKSEDVQRDREAAARAIAQRYKSHVVLKGAHTLVAAPDGTRIYTCEAGNPAMALGGMGDLLSGIIAARWAYLKDPFLAAASAVWLHASASDELVGANPPEDPSVVNTARKVASLRVFHERGSK